MIDELAHRVPDRSPPVRFTSTASALAMLKTLSTIALASSRVYMRGVKLWMVRGTIKEYARGWTVSLYGIRVTKSESSLSAPPPEPPFATQRQRERHDPPRGSHRVPSLETRRWDDRVVEDSTRARSSSDADVARPPSRRDPRREQVRARRRRVRRIARDDQTATDARSPSVDTTNRYAPGVAARRSTPANTPGAPSGTRGTATRDVVSPAACSTNALTAAARAAVARRRERRRARSRTTRARSSRRERAARQLHIDEREGRAFAAAATSVCQKRSNAGAGRSRKRQASSAPLTMSWPAPTGERHTIGRAATGARSESGVRAMASAPAGSDVRPGELRRPQLATVVRSRSTPPWSRCRCPRAGAGESLVRSRPCALSSSSTTLPPRRRRNASSPATSRSPSASGAPTTTASNSESAARSSRRPGGCPGVGAHVARRDDAARDDEARIALDARGARTSTSTTDADRRTAPPTARRARRRRRPRRPTRTRRCTRRRDAQRRRARPPAERSRVTRRCVRRRWRSRASTRSTTRPPLRSATSSVRPRAPVTRATTRDRDARVAR